MSESNINNFNKCQPPICPTDISIDIVEVGCVSGNTLYVRWNVIDNTNKNLLGQLSLNSLLWSCNNQSFNNIIYPASGSQPYETSLNVSNSPGVIYIKIKIKIGTSFFYSKVETIDTSECESLGEKSVRASWCGDCPDSIISPPIYSLYVRSSSVPSYPIYFQYNDLCWHIDDDKTEMLISNLPEGHILTDIDSVYYSCNDCCLQSDCPSSWVDTGDGDRIGTYYFEYQTYSVPSRLYIVKHFVTDDCNDTFTPSPEKILFDTGCASTNKEFSSSFYVKQRKCITTDSPTYGFCVKVRESELPIGIIVDCDCNNITGSYWRICSIDPDGETSSWEGGDECLCSS